MKPLSIWFDFASTYSYPATARAGDLARAAGVTLIWEPFLLGPIFAELGFTDSPFNLQPIKGRYMWRDLERICELHGLPWKKPSVFPINSVLAAKVAIAVRDEPWFERFVRAMFTATFAEGRDLTDPAVVDEVLARFGADGAAVRDKALSTEYKPRLREQVARARALEIFGAPMLTVPRGETPAAGTELFWGNDRVEQAIAFAAAS